MEFEAAVVDFFVETSDLLGVPKSVAAIYGVVFASAEPLSFSDIEDRLELSKGSVSQGLRLLRDVGALKEVSGDGDRSERFEPDLEMRKLAARFIDNRLRQQLDQGKNRLGHLERELATLPPAQQGTPRQRLRTLRRWHNRSRALVPLIRTFLKLT